MSMLYNVLKKGQYTQQVTLPNFIGNWLYWYRAVPGSTQQFPALNHHMVSISATLTKLFSVPGRAHGPRTATYLVRHV